MLMSLFSVSLDFASLLLRLVLAQGSVTAQRFVVSSLLLDANGLKNGN